jgi:DNA-binding GntR family transcriptional regulator
MTKIVSISSHFPPADATSAAEAADVARVLAEDIIFGRLKPGERLIEDNLIARFGVTRHFIRQALQELVRTGIAVREKNKSVKVRSLTAREVRQIYEVRELLQRHAALQIQLPASPELIARLEQLHEEYSRCLEAGDFSGVHAANDAFHLTLFGACDNEYLVDSIRHYMWLTLPVRSNKTADVEHARASSRDHAVMIQMLKGTDRWGLAQLCVDHLQGPKNNYLRSVERDPPRPALADR